MMNHPQGDVLPLAVLASSFCARKGKQSRWQKPASSVLNRNQRGKKGEKKLKTY